MSESLQSLPSYDGFFMPAESHPQQEVWMAWPTRTDNWRYGAKMAQQAFADVAIAISEFSKVVMIVPHDQFGNARAMLPARIRMLEMSFNDSWMRDIGPTYLINGKGERRGVSWQFNAWGGLLDGLYFPWDLDDAVAVKMLDATEDDVYQAPFVLEGGAIHVDGEGTLFTTAECLLHPSRNPALGKGQIEENLQRYLGVEKVIWLPRGLHPCDETNGHIDNLLHVVRPGEIALTWCDDESDEVYRTCREAYDVLSRETDARGRKFRIYKLPAPGPLYRSEDEAAGIDHTPGMVRSAGERLAASYANFLISNEAVIFPLLDSKTDDQARAVLHEAFPDYAIVGVPSREIVLGGGNIHCITQQVPALRSG